ncbi:unnamed protein product, partial [Symbiodinium pilosum]
PSLCCQHASLGQLGREGSKGFPAMPKRFYDDYSDMYLKNSSLAGRKQHMSGRRHINNKIEYWQMLIREKGLTPPIYPPPPGMVLPMPRMAANPPVGGPAGLPKLGALPGMPGLPGMLPGLGLSGLMPGLPGNLGLPGMPKAGAVPGMA